MNRGIGGSPFFFIWFFGSVAYCIFFANISEKNIPWWLVLLAVVALAIDWRIGNRGW
jgi:hypothetical protein